MGLLSALVIIITITIIFLQLLKYTELHKYPNVELMLLILYAYASYLLADGLGLSGIVAILFCGIVMAHYSYNNLSQESKVQ